MPRRLALIALALAFLAACQARDPATGLVRCDDGGDGGVVIDGVCL
jgi:type IV pilus biogenesis protein CpaD/CtpE